MTSKAISAALLFGFVCALGACAPASGPDGGENTSAHGRPIVGGTQASGYPEAVLVNMLQGGQQAAACSGSLIAPQVVLTAGHCVHGFDGWQIIAPYASGQQASASSATVYDWTNESETVDPNMHDIGLVFLDAPINLASYPTLAQSPLPDGAKVVNVGRIDNGNFSDTDLFASQPATVNDASGSGFPYDYIADEIIQPGDSGGPDFAAGTHTIVAVNSGAGGGTEVLARVDLLASWIQDQVANHGGGGNQGGGGSDPGGGGDPGGGAGGSDPGSDPGSGGGDVCGGVTYEGDCQGDVVEWCDGSGVQQIDCAQSGMTCGWNDSAGYYDCI
jgi:hypothetical protein